ncbi:hypothetical protein [Natrarchaeobaculum sulfurireducens]|uniref:Uncharacterized protein n=1 Tax=Natrarchaeobaculum sulfurireducens TaxID=2044521 RepID=A0A346P9E4_9EURY|nr:hypothetical protein [Natrarchaeobaculum sulfurireducens]AXR76139.1 hypothetical protein AArc1_4022 [Natrarchaeobaculum sulfurireducens]
MTNNPHSNTDSTGAQTTSDRIQGRFVRQLALVVVLFSLIAIKPVVAQDDVVCEAEQLPGMISGFFQITTALGIVGLVVVWQADSLAEMFTVNPEQKKGLKQHKRTALKSAVILLVLGPLYTVAGSTMGLPLAECVDLVPW